MTPEQAVFGRSLNCTEVTNRDDDETFMGVLGRHGVAWKASQIRTAAKIALLERDVSEKVRRAMLRQAPLVVGELCAGSRVYFWSPNPFKGRRRNDPERWRGPATVISRESSGRYYLSWRGTVVLIAREQLRHASTVEQGASEAIVQDMAIVGDRQDRAYKNLAIPDLEPKLKKRVFRSFSRKARGRSTRVLIPPEQEQKIEDAQGEEPDEVPKSLPIEPQPEKAQNKKGKPPQI